VKKRSLVIFLVLLVSGPALALDTANIQVQVLAKTGKSWNGKELPRYPKGKPEITVLRIRIPPGAELPLHEHPVINAGVLLRGELTVITQNHQTLHLKAGDPIVEVVDTWHFGVNEGKTPAEIIVFYAGTPDLPITVKKDSGK
jgi:quercetin dioxygenase-like cupin family protein